MRGTFDAEDLLVLLSLHLSHFPSTVLCSLIGCCEVRLGRIWADSTGTRDWAAGRESQHKLNNKPKNEWLQLFGDAVRYPRIGLPRASFVRHNDRDTNPFFTTAESSARTHSIS